MDGRHIDGFGHRFSPVTIPTPPAERWSARSRLETLARRDRSSPGRSFRNGDIARDRRGRRGLRSTAAGCRAFGEGSAADRPRRPEMAPQRLERIESAPGNGKAPGSLHPQDRGAQARGDRGKFRGIAPIVLAGLDPAIHVQAQGNSGPTRVTASWQRYENRSIFEIPAESILPVQGANRLGGRVKPGHDDGLDRPGMCSGCRFWRLTA